MSDEKEICVNCKHFLQHYIWKNNKIIAINCGHCSKNLKNCELPYFKNCKNWKSESAEQAKRKKIVDLKQILMDTATKINKIIARLDDRET